MSLAARIDAAVLAWHQDVVDFLQRRPLWLCRVSLAAVIACDLAFFTLSHIPPLLQALAVLVNVVMAFECRSEAALARAADLRVGPPRLCCFLSLVVMAALLLLAPSPRYAFLLLSAAFVMTFCYFSACRPPRPRAPRGRLSPT